MRLIDADAMIDSLGYYPMLNDVLRNMVTRIVNEQETVPLRREGRWIVDKGVGYECSECWGTYKKPTLYCPGCGSRNKLEDKECPINKRIRSKS